MGLSLQQFVDQLASSGLLASEEVQTALSGLTAGPQPLEVQELARLLVKQKKLTAYQAQQLYNGKGKALVLGNYVILEKLGQGGMGMVLKAEHRRMKRIVALKVLSPAVTKTPEALARFQREVQAAARLEHPHIVSAYDADDANGTHFLVMQYIDGLDLSTIVKSRGPLPVAEALHCVMQAARGLEYAHNHGVIHRDIKPANLLMDGQGTLKILDMGLARIEGETGAQAELTTTGAVMGTVDYMAPEQALSTKHADARSDIYSLGITLYYLLTGRPAYAGDSLMARLLAHRDAPIPSLRKACPLAPPELESLFARMVAKQPENRPQRMGDVLQELQRLQSPGVSAPPAIVPRGEDSKISDFLRGVVTASGGPTVMAPAPVIAVSPGEKTVTVESVQLDSDPQTQQSLKIKSKPPGAPRTRKGSSTSRRLVWLGGGGLGVLLASLAALIVRTAKNEPSGRLSSPAQTIPAIENPQNGATPAGAAPLSAEFRQGPPPAFAPFTSEQAQARQSAWADYLQRPVETTHAGGGRLVLIPPGKFLMGSSDSETARALEMAAAANLPSAAFEWSRVREEGPPHPVTLTRPYYLGATEVTVAQFRKFVEAASYRTLAERFGGGNSNSWTAPPDPRQSPINTWHAPGTVTGNDYPVTQVAWGDAVEYCIWLSAQEQLSPCYERSGELEWKLVPGADGYRLPTEAEWEYACRAGTTTAFSRGDQLSDLDSTAWTSQLSLNSPRPVAGKPANPFGLFDMHGNVREWCQDWYASDYYAQSPASDPPGPDYGTDRVMRGGRYNGAGVSARSAFRYDIAPFLRNANGGFRVARTVARLEKQVDFLTAPEYSWSPPVNLGPLVNSPSQDADPCLSNDGLSLLFSSERPAGQGQSDIWESRRSTVDAPFEKAGNLPRIVNSYAADESPCLSRDGLQLLIASNRPGSTGDFDLYQFRRTSVSSPWLPPENLASVNSPYREFLPSLSADGLTLFFASNRLSDGKGKMDLWRARRPAASGPWGEPASLGPTINTPGDETFAQPLADGDAFLFVRDVELYLAQPNSSGPYRVRPLHLRVDGAACFLTSDGRTLFFQSLRSGGAGGWDLWMTRRAPR